MPVDIAALERPFTHDVVLQVRTGRMKKMAGLTIDSGIDKCVRSGPVPLTFLGLDADEHDPTFHGGPDKAVHGYCARHYEAWAEEYPEAKERFRPGGFGENIVTEHMNERNVCIGDVVRIGDTVELQVVLPRQPCFKLNHRFQLRNFAPQTYAKSRTGWYYKVLTKGSIQAGDKITLLSRPNPQWTIHQVQEYLHRDTTNAQANAELAQLETLGEESRGMFRARVAKAAAAEKRKQTKDTWTPYTVAERRNETSRVLALVLQRCGRPEADNDKSADKITPGSWVRVKLPGGLERKYSVVSGSCARLELGVALADSSRGGSKYIHECLRIGDTVSLSAPVLSVPRAKLASNHILIAGGIGITAFMALLAKFHLIHYNFTLHYAVRSREDVPFAERLAKLDTASGCVRFYRADCGERMDIDEIVRSRLWNSHIYTCGPPRMLDAVQAAVSAHAVDAADVHYEAFAPLELLTCDDPFEMAVAKAGETVLVRVAGHESALDALRRRFPDVPASCEVGNCGTCAVKLCSGRVEHGGTGLTEEQRKDQMLVCVSRGIGQIAIEL